jgi:amino acid permease
MLSLGEMAAFIPVAGSFCTFAGRFVDDGFGFALTCEFISFLCLLSALLEMEECWLIGEAG